MTKSTFNIPVRIYYEDTDAGGVVYYANYLKFFERVRTEWLRSLGIEQDELLNKGIAFVVRSVNMENLASARFNDLLSVTSSIRELKRASLVFSQAILRGETLIATAEVKVACVDLNRSRPVAIPSYIKGAIQGVG